MNLSQKKIIASILEEPQNCITDFDLVYVNDIDLSITRETKKDSFVYFKNNKPLKNKSDIKRIEELVIPPKWKKVRISSLKNGHLQAVGRDDKNRKQYLYHPKWNELRNKTKFFKMVDFGKSLPKIRAKVENDLKQKEWTLTKVLALVITLLEETHIRIGNSQYEKRNKTYGLTTLRSRHLTKEENKLRIEFTGKRGKEHRITVKNKKLIRLVNQCQEIPGWKLFQYYDEKGQKREIDSSQVNEYIQNISGNLFTAKDFRTWSASLICFSSLYDFGIEKDLNKNKKNIINSIDFTAKELGNTRKVCKRYYVHPNIISTYKDFSIEPYFKTIDLSTKSFPFFSSSEQSLLKLFKNYNPFSI